MAATPTPGDGSPVTVYTAILTSILPSGTRHTAWISSDERSVVTDSAEYLAFGVAESNGVPVLVSYYDSNSPEGDPGPRKPRVATDEEMMSAVVQMPFDDEAPF